MRQPKTAFQSPIEDSFFSDEVLQQLIDQNAQLAFQSPIEDSFFSDPAGHDERADAPQLQRFNPLSRIRSSLTQAPACIHHEAQSRRFQSPIEDSFFSDQQSKHSPNFGKDNNRFNPLSRIRSSLTHLLPELPRQPSGSFNPLSRIRSSLTREVKNPAVFYQYAFQSPIEDSFFSDRRV